MTVAINASSNSSGIKAGGGVSAMSMSLIQSIKAMLAEIAGEQADWISGNYQAELQQSFGQYDATRQSGDDALSAAKNTAIAMGIGAGLTGVGAVAGFAAGAGANAKSSAAEGELNKVSAADDLFKASPLAGEGAGEGLNNEQVNERVTQYLEGNFDNVGDQDGRDAMSQIKRMAQDPASPQYDAARNFQANNAKKMETFSEQMHTQGQKASNLQTIYSTLAQAGSGVTNAYAEVSRATGQSDQAYDNSVAQLDGSIASMARDIRSQNTQAAQTTRSQMTSEQQILDAIIRSHAKS